MQLTRLFDPETICNCCLASGQTCHGCDVAQRKDMLLWIAQQIVGAASFDVRDCADGLHRDGVLSLQEASDIAAFQDNITALATRFGAVVTVALGESIITNTQD